MRLRSSPCAAPVPKALPRGLLPFTPIAPAPFHIPATDAPAGPLRMRLLASRKPAPWRGLVMALCLALLPEAVPAQAPWSARTADSGTYLFGNASDPSGTLTLGCTAPSPQGRPAIETGSHESHTTGPYGLTLGLHDSLFDWSATTELTNVVVYVDDIGYRLPPVQLDELLGTGVKLQMTDPMIQAFFSATRLVLDTGQGKAYGYSVAGLAPALDQAQLYCINRWFALGHPLPATLTRYNSQSAAPATAAPAQAFALSQAPPPAADAHIRALCEGEFDVDIDGMQSADFDGDGAGDFIVNWSDITCRGPLGARPFCGAANCQIDIFMSSLGYAAAPSFLGTSTQVVTLPDGRAGFMLGGTSFVCADGVCDRPWVWTGAEFTQ